MVPQDQPKTKNKPLWEPPSPVEVELREEPREFTAEPIANQDTQNSLDPPTFQDTLASENWAAEPWATTG